MRKFLLTLFFIHAVLSSCTVDRSEEVIQDKEVLIEKTLFEFNKSAVKTGKYSKLIATLQDKTSDQEVQDSIEEFLGDQTETFIDLYNQLLALNLSDEEFYRIAYQFRNMFEINSEKELVGCCNALNADSSNTGFLANIIRVVCGCGEPDDTNNQGQGEGNNRD